MVPISTHTPQALRQSPPHLHSLHYKTSLPLTTSTLSLSPSLSLASYFAELERFPSFIYPSILASVSSSSSHLVSSPFRPIKALIFASSVSSCKGNRRSNFSQFHRTFIVSSSSTFSRWRRSRTIASFYFRVSTLFFFAFFIIIIVIVPSCIVTTSLFFPVLLPKL